MSQRNFMVGKNCYLIFQLQFVPAERHNKRVILGEIAITDGKEKMIQMWIK